MSNPNRHPIDLALDNGLTQRELARRLGVTPQAVTAWRRSRHITAARVLDFERVTGIHRHYLNPVIYPDPPRRHRLAGTAAPAADRDSRA